MYFIDKLFTNFVDMMLHRHLPKSKVILLYTGRGQKVSYVLITNLFKESSQ